MKKLFSQKQQNSTLGKIIGKRINPKPLTKTFAPTENWLLCRPEVSFGAKATYARLVQYADKDGVAWPSQEVLAKQLGIKTRQVKTYIQELVKTQLIASQLEGMPASNKYYFLYHPWMDEHSLENEIQLNTDGQKAAPQDLQDGQKAAPQDGQKAAPNNNKENNKENNTHRGEDSVCVPSPVLGKYSYEKYLAYARTQKNLHSAKAWAYAAYHTGKFDKAIEDEEAKLVQQQKQETNKGEPASTVAVDRLIADVLTHGGPLGDWAITLLKSRGYAVAEDKKEKVV